MANIFLDYIKSLVNEILVAPGYEKLDKKEKDKLSKKLAAHFQDMVLETLINRLSAEQLKDVKAVVKKPKLLEEKLEECAAVIPGLAADIEERLQREVKAIKSLA